MNGRFMIASILLLMVGIMGYAAAYDERVIYAPWNGTWDTEADTIIILQNGSSIAGSYEPKAIEKNDPGLLKGTLSEDGKTFSGIWSESGTISLRMSEDKMSFVGTGSVTHEGKTLLYTYTITGNRTSEGIIIENPWSGTWETARANYTLTQNGTFLSGTYIPKLPKEDDPGFIEGDISEDGSVFEGSWYESGTFQFTISDDAMNFTGTYTTNLSDVGQSYPWKGTKIQ